MGVDNVGGIVYILPINRSRENEMHEHTWQPKPNAIEACICGAMRVVESAGTVARRDAITRAFKRRANDVYSGRVCRTCAHALSAHVGDYECKCGCEAFIPQIAMLPLDEEAVFVAPPTARRVN